MPRLDQTMQSHKIGGSFTFSAARVERLGATEYTLVSLFGDETGSTSGYADQIREMLIASIEDCRRSPRPENLLIRVATFGDQYKNGVNEIHGFKPLAEIDTSAYPDLKPGGWTPLNDACYSAIGAQNVYAEKLADQDFSCNGIIFVITDGGENSSVATMDMVKNELEKAVSGEVMESMISILIGINTSQCGPALEKFKREAGFTHYVDAGDVKKGTLAKIAGFISRSVSSQSQAKGTGGPSQNISATI